MTIINTLPEEVTIDIKDNAKAPVSKALLSRHTDLEFRKFVCEFQKFFIDLQHGDSTKFKYEGDLANKMKNNHRLKTDVATCFLLKNLGL